MRNKSNPGAERMARDQPRTRSDNLDVKPSRPTASNRTRPWGPVKGAAQRLGLLTIVALNRRGANLANLVARQPSRLHWPEAWAGSELVGSVKLIRHEDFAFMA